MINFLILILIKRKNVKISNAKYKINNIALITIMKMNNQKFKINLKNIFKVLTKKKIIF